MSQKLDERLNQILPRLTSPDVLANKGSGGEIGFWIFDYPPEDEMAVRAFLQDVVLPTLAKHQPPIKAADINLFDLVTGVLEERNLLDKAIEMQRTQGDAKTLESLRSAVEQRLSAPSPSATTATPDGNGIGRQLAEGLNALREDLSRAISVVHTGTMAEAMKRMEHEMEMVHSTLASLKDMTAQQRDHLRNAQ